MGETLTADTTGIADPDGLADVSYAYQWIAGGSDISGATASSYTLRSSEEGQTIHVRVSFTDDGDNMEELTSEPTGTVAPANNPAAGVPIINGIPRVGETLTVDVSGISDADGMENATFSYSWYARDNSGKRFFLGGGVVPYYVVQSRDEGMRIRVGGYFTDDAGNHETLTTAATAAVAAAANPTVPEAPAHRRVGPPLGVAPRGSGELEVSWRWHGYPYGDGGSVVTGGKVQWKEAADSWDTDADVSEALIPGDCSLCRYTITGLTNGVAYTARVFATNAIGDSPPSDELTSTPTDGTTLTLSGITKTDYPEDEGCCVVPRYTVTGAQAAITWSLSGDDSDAFSINTGGSLRFTRWGSYENPTDADRDNQYQVTVQASDGTNTATLQVVVVVISRGRPMINGDAQVGQTLTVDTLGITDADGLHNPNFTYQWISNDGTTDSDIAGATASTHTLTDSEEGKTIKVRVSFSDDAGNDETLTSTVTDAVLAAPRANSPATGAPAITGTSQVGETLTANTSGIADDDGLDNVAYTYQWLSSRDTEIQGAKDRTYTLAATDEGKAIKVRVNFTDDANNPETLTSAATAAVAPKPNSPATGLPTIDGAAPQVGQTLTVETSGIADADGRDNAVFSYQWISFDGTTDTAIQGATNSTYILAEADEGKAIKVRVTFTDDAGNDETLTSTATGPVAATTQPNNPATGAPTISGTAQVGETLTANTSGVADEDGLTGATFSYQWLSSRDTEIGGATSFTYTLVASDEGKAIKVEVTFTDDAGNDESLTSGATEAVAAAEPSEPPDKPRGLSATASHDQVTLTWEDPSDDSITGYVVLRRVRVNDVGGEFSVLVPDTGTAATTYTDDTVAAGTTYTYRIKAINGAGTSERSRWFHIDIPAAPVPDKPTGLSATATHDQVVLTWNDPGDDSITGYVVLRRLRYDDPKGHFDELVADTGTAAATYTDDTVAAGTSYTYRIKAINGAGPGERSRWYHIDTPAAP